MYKYLANTDILMYDAFVSVGYLAVMVFLFCQLGKKKLFPGKVSERIINYTKSRNKKIPIETIAAIIEIYLISTFHYSLGGTYNSIVGKLFSMGANYYGMVYFGPLLVALLCLLMGTDLIKTFDMITPSYPLGLIFAKIACFCGGCCNGIECSFGLYNHDTGLVEFPVQLVEAGLALLIFILLMFWRKKAKEGTLFPIYVILYSSTRFFSEFLRSEPDVIWKLKTYHIFCIVGVIVGIIELLIVLKFGEKIKDIFASNFIIKIIDKRAAKKKEMKKKIIHHKYKKK